MALAGSFRCLSDRKNCILSFWGQFCKGQTQFGVQESLLYQFMRIWNSPFSSMSTMSPRIFRWSVFDLLTSGMGTRPLTVTCKLATFSLFLADASMFVSTHAWCSCTWTRIWSCWCHKSNKVDWLTDLLSRGICTCFQKLFWGYCFSPVSTCDVSLFDKSIEVFQTNKNIQRFGVWASKCEFFNVAKRNNVVSFQKLVILR